MAYTSSQVVQAVPVITSSGLTLITAGTSSSTSSLNITNCFSASYKVYQVYLYSISFASSNQAVNLRYGTNGTPDTTSRYWSAIGRIDSQGNQGGVGTANQDKTNLGANYGNHQGGSSINITIVNPFDAKTTYAQGQGVGNYAASTSSPSDFMYTFDFHTQMNTTTSYTDLNLFPNTSTVVINYAIYGLAPS